MHTCVVACSAGQAHLRNGDSLLQGAAQCAIYYFPACRGCQRHWLRLWPCTGYSFGRAPSTATSQTKNPQNCLHSPEEGAGKGKRPRTVPPTSTVCVCTLHTSTGIAGRNIHRSDVFLFSGSCFTRPPACRTRLLPAAASFPHWAFIVTRNLTHRVP